MTIDLDYKLNWNKENLAVGGLMKKKTVSLKHSEAKRVILGELCGIAAETNSPKRSRTEFESNTFVSVTPRDIEEQKQKWAEIALTLRCDTEQPDNELMDELLKLCSWYDVAEKPIGEAVEGSQSSASLWVDYSDEDDEDDDAFLSYIRSQHVAFGSSQTKHPQRTLLAHTTPTTSNDLHLSSLRLKSRLSLLDGRGLNSTGSSDSVSLTLSKDCSPFSSSEMMERAFMGEMSDMNNVAKQPNDCSVPKTMFEGAVAISSESQAIASSRMESDGHDFWADVDFC